MDEVLKIVAIFGIRYIGIAICKRKNPNIIKAIALMDDIKSQFLPLISLLTYSVFQFAKGKSRRFDFRPVFDETNKKIKKWLSLLQG